MHNTDNSLFDLEAEHGTVILSGLCGQALTRNGQNVRLLDQTKHSAEIFFKSDNQGKPYIQDFQNGKRYYPVTAYAEFYGLDFKAAKAQLIQEYYGESTTGQLVKRTPKQRIPTAPPPVDYLPTDKYQRCQTHFERNGLYEYLRFTYGPEKANEAFTRYRLGTSHRWQYLGYLATVLPQFDIAENLRQIKIIVFDAMSGRRVKKHQTAEKRNAKTGQYEPTAPDSDKIYFAGKQLAKSVGINAPNLKQSFFGEYLLTEYPGQSVGIVEAESTAIICSILLSDFVWLATGGSNGARWTDPETFRVLAGRNVTLWPDTGKFDLWTQKADGLRPLVQSLHVTDYVERNAPPGMSNVDLRDLLSRPRWLRDGQIIYGESL